MVDVTPKEPTHRRAIARGKVFMKPETTSLDRAWGRSPRATCSPWPGSPASRRRRRTPDLIPLCHPLLVGSVFINFRIEDRYIEVEAQVETVDRTGVEMEALTACTVAALTIYDMCKSADRSMVIGDITLWEKTGGRSGTYRRDPLADLEGSGLEGLGGLSGTDDDLGLGLDLDDDAV